ncbi:hypothetical protein HMPREF1550_01302 [Actinomyces sp. oral taxon 877 str. F0543]|nr:hypothetical protein HMPREF1550_01302 [Actinomyces sp. oral taxon 877 str. F0543]
MRWAEAAAPPSLAAGRESVPLGGQSGHGAGAAADRSRRRGGQKAPQDGRSDRSKTRGTGVGASRRAGPPTLGGWDIPGQEAASTANNPTGILTLTALQKYPIVLDLGHHFRP